MAMIELHTTTATAITEEEQKQPNHVTVDVKTFLDLGWGLDTIDLANPYQKTYAALIYVLISLLFVVLSIFIRNYTAALIISIIHTMLHCIVFVSGTCNYYFSDKKIKDSSSEQHFISDTYTRITSITPSLLTSMYQFTESEQLQRKTSNNNTCFTSIRNSCAKFYRELTSKFNRNSCVMRTFACFAKFDKFFCSFDALFGRTDEPLLFRPYYFQFSMVSYGVFTSIYILCIISSYKASLIDICETSNWKNVLSTRQLFSKGDQCLSYTSTTYIYYECVILWIGFLAFHLLDLNQVKPAYFEKINHIKTKLMKTFGARSIENFGNRVDQRIYSEITAKLMLKPNVMLWMIVLTVIGSVILFHIKRGDGAAFHGLLWALIGSMIFANCAMSVFKICTLSKYSLTIATLFGEPIYCDTKNDVLGWWQLRHVYTSYHMPIFVDALTPVMVAAFTLVVFLLVVSLWDAVSFPIVPFGVAIVLAVLMLYWMQQFVAAYAQQTKHIGMLQRETLRITTNGEKNANELKDIISIMTEHMKEYDGPIVIAGIQMTNAVFVFLRGAICAIALIIITKLIESDESE